MIPLALILFPFVELGLVVLLIQRYGWINCLFAWVFVTLLGFGLLRTTGARVALGIARALKSGQSPAESALLQGLIGIAALLLVVPGVLSSVFGGLLLLPQIRKLLAKRLSTSNWRPSQHSQEEVSVTEEVIDVEAVEVKPES